jgi:hypothetical protein
MKFLAFVFAFLVVPTTCMASWVSQGTITGIGTLSTSSFKWAVYDNSANGSAYTANGFNVAAGKFGYFYQFSSLTAPIVSSLSFLVNPADITIGVIDNKVLDVSGVPTATATASTDMTLYNLTPTSIDFGIVFPTAPLDSAIMVLTSTRGLTLGTINVTGFGGSGIISAPVPVPVPPAIALMMLGLPMVGLIRRRLSK